MNTLESVIYSINKSTQEDLEKHLLNCDRDFFIPLSEKVDIIRYSHKIRNNSITFEAWDGSILVGLIACYANDPVKNDIFITNVSVLSDYRNKGIAKHLFNEILFQNTTIQTLKTITLKAYKYDVSTIKLYKSLHFVKVQEEEDQIIMQRKVSKDEPLVSICCITYNHINYIHQCLDSFLIQQTVFPFEILIHDDASTDGTADIIHEYEIKYPDIVKPIYQAENQYSKGVSISATFNWSRAKGKYIAMCEGDDYWTDPLKLQKQINILEQNPTINICSHPSMRLYGNKIKKDGYGFWGEEGRIIPVKEVIANYASTAPLQSIVFRNQNIQDIIAITKNLLGGHSSLQIFYSIPNGIYYLPDYMSVYRVGSSSSISKVLFKNDKTYLDRQKQNWKGLDLINEYTNYSFDKDFRKSKQLRALGAINTGYLKPYQIVSLIKEYKLYSVPWQLFNSLRLNLKNKKIN